MNNHLKTIKLTVMDTTAEGLQQMSESSNLTVGEVVDRLTVRIRSKDPQVTYMLLMDDIMVLTAHLSPQDKGGVIGGVIRDILSGYSSEDIDQIVSEARKLKAETQKILDRKLSDLTEEERKLLNAALANTGGKPEKEPDV